MKLIISLLLVLTVYAHANTITIVAQGNCPYICQNDPDKKGFLIDMVTYIFGKAGYTVNFTASSSQEQAIEDVRIHKVDAIIGISPQEAPGLIFPKSPLVYSYDVMVVPSYSKWKYTSTSSLDDLVLGLEEGRIYKDEINKHIEKNKGNENKVQLTSGSYALKNNLLKLRFEKVSAIIEDRSVLRNFYFEKKKPFAFKVAHTYQTKSIYIAFSPKDYKSKQYAEILYQWQQKLEETPEMKEILKNYGLTQAYIKPLLQNR